MMKLIYLIFILFLVEPLVGQEHNRILFGTSVSGNNGSYVILQAESDIDIAFIRAEFRTNFEDDNFVYVKMAFRVYHTDNFEFFAAMPPMYYKLGKGYVTPFNFEVQYKEQMCINLDIYRDKPVLSIQLRLPIRHK